MNKVYCNKDYSYIDYAVNMKYIRGQIYEYKILSDDTVSIKSERGYWDNWHIDAISGRLKEGNISRFTKVVEID